MPNISPKIHTMQFLFKLSPILKRQLTAKARANGVTRGEYLRRLIALSDVVQPKQRKLRGPDLETAAFLSEPLKKGKKAKTILWRKD